MRPFLEPGVNIAEGDAAGTSNTFHNQSQRFGAGCREEAKSYSLIEKMRQRRNITPLLIQGATPVRNVLVSNMVTWAQRGTLI